ncbi:hypothetical protein ACU8KH_02185 [Lachancea thermotolerans]
MDLPVSLPDLALHFDTLNCDKIHAQIRLYLRSAFSTSVLCFSKVLAGSRWLYSLWKSFIKARYAEYKSTRIKNCCRSTRGATLRLRPEPCCPPEVYSFIALAYIPQVWPATEACM